MESVDINSKHYFIEFSATNTNTTSIYTELYEEESILKLGKGHSLFGGLSHEQVDFIMSPYETVGFKGVFSLDTLEDIKINPDDEQISFILNLEPKGTPFGHFVAVYIDKDDSVEYFDPLADESEGTGDPPEIVDKVIKKIVEVIDPDVYLKYKINRIRYQDSNSDNCGYFVVKFLMDRYAGKKFKEASGFERNAEKDIEKWKKRFEFDSL